MKVQVWTKFSKKQLWKKVKSPLSMNFGRISTSKCRGKLQKMGVLYTHSLKSPGPSPKLPKILSFKIKKFQKNLNCPIGSGVDPRPAGDRWSPAGPGPLTCARRPAVGARSLPGDQAPTASRWQSDDQRSPPTGRRPRAGRRLAVARRLRVDTCAYGAVPIFLEFFFLRALHFLCKWSTLAGWLQHMPALPRLLLETSNIHNF
jgi:hypothetical protein